MSCLLWGKFNALWVGVYGSLFFIFVCVHFLLLFFLFITPPSPPFFFSVVSSSSSSNVDARLLLLFGMRLVSFFLWFLGRYFEM